MRNTVPMFVSALDVGAVLNKKPYKLQGRMEGGGEVGREGERKVRRYEHQC